MKLLILGGNGMAGHMLADFFAARANITSSIQPGIRTILAGCMWMPMILPA